MRDWVIKVLGEIISRNAVNPAHSGPGEKERADYIQNLLENMGLKTKRYEVIDNKGIVRPSIVTEIGEGKTIWLIAHIDTVSPGSGWTKDPFKLTIEGGKVFGRGVNDNGIGIMAALIVLKKIVDEKIELRYKLKVGFVADEEAGSTYGLKHLVNEGVFSRGDRAIIPDAGNEEGTMVEIAEKAILWLKFITKGKQTHGSTPHRGDNAFLKSMRMANELYDTLHEKFSDSDELFDPPVSTFEPTMKDKNTDSINIIPGEDVHYWDCRILPQHNLEDVLEIIDRVSKKYDTEVEVVMKEEASRVEPEDWIVVKLTNSIRKVLGKEPKLMGIGGGTFASILRKIGVPSVVWHIGSGTEHQPDEWELLSNYFKNAEVLLDVLTT